jgi:photosystem II stability/assembly factor-like uncharacterized protein
MGSHWHSLSLVVALVLAILTGQAQAQPLVSGRQWLSPQPTGENLNAIWGDGTGIWTVGQHGTIARSVDHGATWVLSDSGSKRNLRAIWGSSARDLWVVGDGGTVLRSTDGGARWQAVEAGVTGNLCGIWGSGPGDLYLVGDGGQLLRTHDSGRTFALQRPLGDSDERLTTVWGSAADDVYLGGSRGSVLASSDGGEHWQARKAQPPRRDGTGGPRKPGRGPVSGSEIISLTGSGRGQLLVIGSSWIRGRKGSSSGGYVQYSPDGGKSWQAIAFQPAPTERSEGATSFYAADPKTVYALGTFEVFAPSHAHKVDLVVSRDGGASFERRAPFPGGARVSFWREPAGPLLAVGGAGALWRSLDDGSTWQERTLRPFGSVMLWAAWSDLGREVWAVGDACTVLHSGDGGATFETRRPCPTEVDNLQSVWGSSASDVYVAGSAIYHTRDRGKSWSQVTPPCSQDGTWRVWGSGADDVYAVGYYMGVWHSTDRAKTWRLVVAGVPSGSACKQSREAFGTGPDDVYLVTGCDELLHSGTGGATWDTVLGLQTPRPAQRGEVAERSEAGEGKAGLVREGSGPSPGGGTGTCSACIRQRVRPELYAMGADRSLIRTDAGTRSWQRFTRPSAVPAAFGAILRRGADLFVLGDGADGPAQTPAGVLLRSPDRGQSWQPYALLPWGCTSFTIAGNGDFMVFGRGLVLRVR